MKLRLKWSKKLAKRLFILANLLAWMVAFTAVFVENTDAQWSAFMQLKEQVSKQEPPSPRYTDLVPYLEYSNDTAYTQIWQWQFVGAIHALLPFLLLIYGNWFFLIPRYLAKQRYRTYLLSLILCWATASTLLLHHAYYGAGSLFPTGDIVETDVSNLFTAIVIGFGTLAVSMPAFFSVNWFVQQEQLNVLENERLQSELALLKSQINPHFFFNTLNNLYALALDQSVNTPAVILRLSDLMRYTIYEGNSAFVPLELESKCLEDYLALQRIRLHREADIRMVQELRDPNIPVVPLLFLSFVENAFKHGVDTLSTKPFVHIELRTNDNYIHFLMENNYDPLERQAGAGTGIENSRRRMQLLYPGKHTLSITDQDHIFRVAISIQT